MVFKLAGHYPTTQAYTDRFASLFLPCVFIIFITFIILKCTYLVNKDYKRLKIGPSFRTEYPNWQFKWWVQLVSVFTNISLQSNCQQMTCRLSEYCKTFRELLLTALIRTLVSVTKEGDFVRSGPEIADEVSWHCANGGLI